MIPRLATRFQSGDKLTRNEVGFATQGVGIRPKSRDLNCTRLGKKLVTDYFKIGQNPPKTVGQLFATILFSFQRDQRISKWTRITELGLKIPRSARTVRVRFPPSAPCFPAFPMASAWPRPFIMWRTKLQPFTFPWLLRAVPQR